MKTVFDNGMVAHVWAQRSQAEGRSHNGNFSFSGNNLYSYRTCIGAFHTGADGKLYVLTTSESYSHTTSGKHKPAMRRAIGPDVIEFTVPSPGRPDYSDNLPHLVKAFTDAAKPGRWKAGPDWRGTPQEQLESRKADLHGAYATVAAYCAAFGIECPALDLEAALAAVQASYDAFHSEGAAAKRAKAAAKRDRVRAALDERRAGADAEFDAWQAGTGPRPPLELFKGRAWESRQKSGAIQNAIRAEKRKADFQKWLAGESIGAPGADERGRALLRVQGDVLQTSQGAEVPLDHAVKAFGHILRNREAATVWTANGHSITVGHFKIDKIEADGTIRAGCHVIAWAEIERVARQLGLAGV